MTLYLESKKIRPTRTSKPDPNFQDITWSWKTSLCCNTVKAKRQKCGTTGNSAELGVGTSELPSHLRSQISIWYWDLSQGPIWTLLRTLWLHISRAVEKPGLVWIFHHSLKCREHGSWYLHGTIAGIIVPFHTHLQKRYNSTSSCFSLYGF